MIHTIGPIVCAILQAGLLITAAVLIIKALRSQETTEEFRCIGYAVLCIVAAGVL